MSRAGQNAGGFERRQVGHGSSFVCVLNTTKCGSLPKKKSQRKQKQQQKKDIFRLTYGFYFGAGLTTFPAARPGARFGFVSGVCLCGRDMFFCAAHSPCLLSVTFPLYIWERAEFCKGCHSKVSGNASLRLSHSRAASPFFFSPSTSRLVLPLI